MSLSTHGHEYLVAAARAAPPLTVTGVTAVGWGLQDWVLIVTLIYTLLQIALMIRKYIVERTSEKRLSRATAAANAATAAKAALTEQNQHGS